MAEKKEKGMITQENIFDVLEKLIGSVKPIGETNHDENALANQNKLISPNYSRQYNSDKIILSPCN